MDFSGLLLVILAIRLPNRGTRPPAPPRADQGTFKREVIIMNIINKMVAAYQARQSRKAALKAEAELLAARTECFARLGEALVRLSVCESHEAMNPWECPDCSRALIKEFDKAFPHAAHCDWAKRQRSEYLRAENRLLSVDLESAVFEARIAAR